MIWQFTKSLNRKKWTKLPSRFTCMEMKTRTKSRSTSRNSTKTTREKILKTRTTKTFGRTWMAISIKEGARVWREADKVQGELKVKIHWQHPRKSAEPFVSCTCLKLTRTLGWRRRKSIWALCTKILSSIWTSEGWHASEASVTAKLRWMQESNLGPYPQQKKKRSSKVLPITLSRRRLSNRMKQLRVLSMRSLKCEQPLKKPLMMSMLPRTSLTTRSLKKRSPNLNLKTLAKSRP